ncbi:MAG TPA: hypothetical protein VGM19_14245 [Armatimonadota bacterium]|jgi:hypothetical protein
MRKNDQLLFDDNPVFGPMERALRSGERRLGIGYVIAGVLPVLAGIALNDLVRHPTAITRPGGWIGVGASGSLIAITLLSVATLRRRSHGLDIFQWIVVLGYLILAIALAAFMLGCPNQPATMGLLVVAAFLTFMSVWWGRYYRSRRDGLPIESVILGVLFTVGVGVMCVGWFFYGLQNVWPEYRPYIIALYPGGLIAVAAEKGRRAALNKATG